MEIFKIITLSIWCIIQIGLSTSDPTFVDEYVHIKLHVPKNIVHKHIHHFHHRRKPHKKPTHLQEPLFENIILSELDNKPETDTSEATVEDEEAKVPKVDTYTVIEETVKKPLHPPPSQHVETLRIIEKKPSPAKTVKLVTTEPLHYYPQNSGYRTQTHKETIKIISEHEPQYHKPVSIYEQPKLREEIYKVITPPSHSGSLEDYNALKSAHYDYEEHVSKPVSYIQSEDYYVYEKPKIVEDVHTYQPYSKHTALSSHFSRPDYEIQQYNGTPEHHEYNTSPDSHEYIEHGPRVPEDGVKYIEESNSIQQPYIPQKEPNEESIYNIPKHEIRGQTQYHPKPLYKPPIKENPYHHPATYSQPHHEEHSSSEESIYYAPQPQYHPKHAEYNDHVEEYKKPYAEHYRGNSHYADNSNIEHNVGYEKQPLSPSTYIYQKPTRYPKDTSHEVVTSASQVHHNTLLDELPNVVPPVPKKSPTIDWPEMFAKTPTIETYTGHDSYTAGHVQGLDSDEYNDGYP
ncbi:uncharacterized protein isoform X2 [Musca autumnalis]|uniref:uncharacterized protein isoform X2 n=1 Tax=Musca autumnalis TaxID=221902 RepID=UPI003CF0CC43